MATHRFLGDRHAPELHPSVREQRALQGTGARPVELERMASVRTIYSRTETRERPEVIVESVAHENENVWKIDVPVTDPSGARLGRTLERHPPDKYLAEIGEDVSVGAYRPAWIDALPAPDSSRAVTRHFMRPARRPSDRAAVGV